LTSGVARNLLRENLLQVSWQGEWLENVMSDESLDTEMKVGRAFYMRLCEWHCCSKNDEMNAFKY